MTKAAAVFGIALAAGACGRAVDTPTGPSSLTLTTVTFMSSLAIGGSRFYSFTVSEAGTVVVTLASVTSPTTGIALQPVLELGVGVPAGTGCTATTLLYAAPALTAHVHVASQPGVYCVSVADIGNLSAPVNFAIRFTHP